LRPVPFAPVLDVVAAVEGHRFTRFDVEHTVGPLLAARLGGTYLRRTAVGREPGEPDLTVRVSVRDRAATAAIRVAARPLHRRPWKLDTGPGTLHPPVAAALVRLAAPRESVLDPFCGDGTIAIEAALVRPAARVVGRDLDPARLQNARGNAERAGVVLDLDVADAAGTGAAGFDAVVTNPPWNLAVGGAGRLRGGLDPLWRRLPRLLAPDGRIVAVTDATLDAPGALTTAGLRVGLSVRVRVAGRLSDVVLASPTARPSLPEALHRWRRRAIAADVGL
jgi:23S rRNA G2445 N2-methylase RlmL